MRAGARHQQPLYMPTASRPKVSTRPQGKKTVTRSVSRFLKHYRVFNIDQCDNLPRDLYAQAPDLPQCEQLPIAEKLIKSTAADFRIGGNRAYYVPGEDFIQVPPQPLFRAQIDYAREELVAEMTSAFIYAALGIIPTVRHADYIGSWLDVLRADDKAIFRAVSKASKAADYILAFHGGDGAKNTPERRAA